MPPFRQCSCRTTRACFALLLLAPASLFAGGGPFNTLVVVNTNSADSVELGTYYAAAHAIPAHQICPLGIDTNLATLTATQFRNWVLNPIRNHIAAENLNGQIDFLVLCQQIPTRVRDAEGVSASLFYGFKNAPNYSEEGCNLPAYTSNAYYRAERAFRSTDGWNATNGFVAFHLIASNLPTAKLVAARGAAAQSSFPSSTIYLYMLGSGPRGLRETLFANTQFLFTALPGLPLSCLIAAPYAVLSGKTNVIGYHDGYGTIPADVRTNNVWMAGAYADHMTSCGGMLPDPCLNQSTVLDWMDIGATASYGTVAEPCAYVEKFPDPLLGFYQARGFTLGEAYAMSVAAPYQGLFAGDPLAAPFAAPPVLSVTSHVPGQIVTGTVPVQVSAAAHAHGVPAASVDLYLDERYHTNLASLGPSPGNILSCVVAGCTNSAGVATNHTLFGAVAALAAAINADSNQIVSASARGDRLELIYKDFNHAGDNAPVSASVAPGAAPVLTLGVGLAATNLHPSLYPARKQVWLYTHTTNGANAGDSLACIITLTNGVAVTNILVAAQGEQVADLFERLSAAINTHALLAVTNGIRYDRLSQYPVPYGFLIARTPGPDGAGIQIDFNAVPVSTNSGLTTNANFSAFCRGNADDIRPRASVLFHVTPTNGVIEAVASLDTTLLADGLHLLDFIARDGSAVAAASRVSLPLIVCNSSSQLAVLGTNGATVANGEAPSLAKGTDFGPVQEGQSLTNLFAIHNNGSDVLTIANQTLNGAGAAAFRISGVPATVAAGGVSNFTLVFAPATTGAYQAVLAFASDAIAPQTNILLSGAATPSTYWLATSAGEHGSVNPASSWQPAGTTALITAIADLYYHFAGWNGDASGTNNPFALLMDAPKTVQAHFAANLATNNTPEWWLALHGWTHDFDAAALDDAEPDGFPTWQEFIADTDPTNATFYPRVAFVVTGGTNPVVTWPASTGRVYQIHRADDLVNGSWITQQLSLGVGEWTDTNPPPPASRYYRIAPLLP